MVPFLIDPWLAWFPISGCSVASVALWPSPPPASGVFTEDQCPHWPWLTCTSLHVLHLVFFPSKTVSLLFLSKGHGFFLLHCASVEFRFFPPSYLQRENSEHVEAILFSSQLVGLIIWCEFGAHDSVFSISYMITITALLQGCLVTWLEQLTVLFLLYAPRNWTTDKLRVLSVGPTAVLSDVRCYFRTYDMDCCQISQQSKKSADWSHGGWMDGWK